MATQRPARRSRPGLRSASGAWDEQADLSVQGGFEKAVYGYSLDHYRAWRYEIQRHAAALMPGAFGGNLCIQGLREADIRVGDLHRIGGSRLQVCQLRQPCVKLALRFEDMMMPKAMVQSGRAGWAQARLRQA
jgi:MOSC domain-containing protein YiiM